MRLKTDKKRRAQSDLSEAVRVVRTVEEIPTAVHLNLRTVAEDGGAPDASLDSENKAYHGRIIVNNLNDDRYGGGQAHNNVTPAKAVYAWLRTA